jgi:hypothetical protein
MKIIIASFQMLQSLNKFVKEDKNPGIYRMEMSVNKTINANLVTVLMEFVLEFKKIKIVLFLEHHVMLDSIAQEVENALVSLKFMEIVNQMAQLVHLELSALLHLVHLAFALQSSLSKKML